MKIIRAYPPNFVELTKHFPIRGRPGLLFAWGDRLYNPSGVEVPPWLRAHEGVHGMRQGIDVEGWWLRYIHDAAFRLREEAVAHQVEWETFVGQGHGAARDQAHYLQAMIARLSGPLYGDLISRQDAEDVILKRRML